jgi:transposase
LRKLGHQPRIMAAVFVEPYRQGGKNDANDAAAICGAMSRPKKMRFLAVKPVEQQAVLAAHRLRQGLVEERTALASRVRGLLAEGLGITAPKLDFALDLDGYTKWQLCKSDGTACMSPDLLTKNTDDEISKSVDHRRLTGEARG